MKGSMDSSSSSTSDSDFDSSSTDANSPRDKGGKRGTTMKKKLADSDSESSYNSDDDEATSHESQMGSDEESEEGINVEEELGLSVANAQLQTMMSCLLERSKVISAESLQQDEKATVSFAHIQQQLLLESSTNSQPQEHIGSSSKRNSKRKRDLIGQLYMERCMTTLVDLLQEKREKERVHMAAMMQEVQGKYEDALGGIVTCFNRHTQWVRDSYITKINLHRKQVKKQRDDENRLHEALIKEREEQVRRECREEMKMQQQLFIKHESELKVELKRILAQNSSLVNVQKNLRKQNELQTRQIDEYKVVLGERKIEEEPDTNTKQAKDKQRAKITQLQAQVRNLQEKLSKSQDKVTVQQKTIRGLEKTIAKLEDNIADLQEQVVELGNMLSAVREHLSEVQMELERVTGERDALASTCESLKNKCAKLDDAKKELTNKVNDLNTTIKRKQVEHGKEVLELKAKLTKLENENSVVQVKFAESEEKLQMSHKQIGELQMSIIKALSAQENAQKTIEEVQRTAELQIRRKEEEVERLGLIGESAKLQLEKKVSGLEQELSKAKTALEHKDHESLRMQATITQLSKQIESHNTQQKIKEKKLGDESKRQVAKLQETITKLEQQQADLLKKVKVQGEQLAESLSNNVSNNKGVQYTEQHVQSSSVDMAHLDTIAQQLQHAHEVIEAVENDDSEVYNNCTRHNDDALVTAVTSMDVVIPAPREQQKGNDTTQQTTIASMKRHTSEVVMVTSKPAHQPTTVQRRKTGGISKQDSRSQRFQRDSKANVSEILLGTEEDDVGGSVEVTHDRNGGKAIQLPKSGKSVIVLKKKVEEDMRKYIEEALIDEVRHEMTLRMEQGLTKRIRLEQKQLMKLELKALRAKETEELESLFGRSTGEWEQKIKTVETQLEETRKEVRLRDSMVKELETCVTSKDEELHQIRISLSEKEMLLQELLNLNRRYKAELEKVQNEQRDENSLQSGDALKVTCSKCATTPSWIASQASTHTVVPTKQQLRAQLTHQPKFGSRPATVAQSSRYAAGFVPGEAGIGSNYSLSLPRPHTTFNPRPLPYSTRLTEMKALKATKKRSESKKLHVRTRLKDSFLNGKLNHTTDSDKEVPKMKGKQSSGNRGFSGGTKRVLVPLRQNVKTQTNASKNGESDMVKSIYFGNSALEAMKSRGLSV